MQAGEGDTNIQVSSRHARVGMVPVMRSVSGLPWRVVPLGFEQVWEETLGLLGKHEEEVSEGGSGGLGSGEGDGAGAGTKGAASVCPQGRKDLFRLWQRILGGEQTWPVESHSAPERPPGISWPVAAREPGRGPATLFGGWGHQIE